MNTDFSTDAPLPPEKNRYAVEVGDNVFRNLKTGKLFSPELMEQEEMERRVMERLHHIKKPITFQEFEKRIQKLEEIQSIVRLEYTMPYSVWEYTLEYRETPMRADINQLEATEEDFQFILGDDVLTKTPWQLRKVRREFNKMMNNPTFLERIFGKHKKSR